MTPGGALPKETELRSPNNRNHLFLKVLIGVNVTLLGAGVMGGIKLYGDVSVLKSATALEKKVDTMSATLDSINADRHKRTEIIQQFKDQISELQRKVETLERKR